MSECKTDKDGKKVKKGELLSNVKENQSDVWDNLLNNIPLSHLHL